MSPQAVGKSEVAAPEVHVDTSYDDDVTLYHVVVNEEEQFSIWPVGEPIPLGWQSVGTQGLRTQCLDYIDRVWTDMRPRSLRRKLEHEG